MAPAERNRTLKLLVSDEEMAMVRALADRDGVSIADLVRQLVRRAHAEAFGPVDAKKKLQK